jgi:hypothetical protein
MGVRLLYLRVSSRELIVRRKLAEILSHHFVVQVLKFDSKEALALFFFSEQAKLRYVVVRLFFFSELSQPARSGRMPQRRLLSNNAVSRTSFTY